MDKEILFILGGLALTVIIFGTTIYFRMSGSL